MLPEELRVLLAEKAHRRGTSIGALIRKALVQELTQDGAEQDSFLGDTRLAGGATPSNVAEQHDVYLYGEKS
jgi:hypothetical protein